MKLYTREELEEICNVSKGTIIGWCRGWHFLYGKKKYFFPDHFKVKAIEGKGKKGSPYLYDRGEVEAYQTRVMSKRYTREK